MVTYGPAARSTTQTLALFTSCWIGCATTTPPSPNPPLPPQQLQNPTMPYPLPYACTLLHKREWLPTFHTTCCVFHLPWTPHTCWIFFSDPPRPPCSPYPGTAGRACFLQHNVYLNLGFVFDCWQTKNPIYLFLSSKIWMYGTCSININSLTPFFVTHNSSFLSSKQ